LIAWLVQVYALLGRLRGLQSEQTGFVFFEQAVELCRMTECSPALEAGVLREYAVFLSRTGSSDLARAYVERSLDIFQSLGENGEVERSRQVISQLSA